jgi:hypothetical protein
VRGSIPLLLPQVQARLSLTAEDRSPRSALGPCHNGRVRASAVASGHQRSGDTAGRRPSSSRSRDDGSVRFGLWSRRSGVRAAALLAHRASLRHANGCAAPSVSGTNARLAGLFDTPQHQLKPADRLLAPFIATLSPSEQPCHGPHRPRTASDSWPLEPCRLAFDGTGPSGDEACASGSWCW